MNSISKRRQIFILTSESATQTLCKIPSFFCFIDYKESDFYPITESSVLTVFGLVTFYVIDAFRFSAQVLCCHIKCADCSRQQKNEKTCWKNKRFPRDEVRRGHVSMKQTRCLFYIFQTLAWGPAGSVVELRSSWILSSRVNIHLLSGRGGADKLTAPLQSFLQSLLSTVSLWTLSKASLSEKVNLPLTSDPSAEMFGTSSLYWVECDNWKIKSLSIYICICFTPLFLTLSSSGGESYQRSDSPSPSFVSSSCRRTNWTCPAPRCTAPSSPTAGQSLTSTPPDTRACRWETPTSASPR